MPDPARGSSLSLSARCGRSLLLTLLIWLVSASPDHHEAGTPANPFNQQLFARAQQVVRPALTLILPQSFKVPTNPFRDEQNAGAGRQQQFVAVINNARNDLEDQQIRREFKKLCLQIRDASPPQTGQLFFETSFDYFAPGSHGYLLIPVNLEQVSPVWERARIAAPNRQQTGLASGSERLGPAAGRGGQQQLIVSIRPCPGAGGLGGETEVLVSSAPVLVEPVPSADGQRTFAIVQTDKPIYKPNELVRIRAMVVSEALRPIVGDELRLQVRNPHKLVVEEARFPRALERQSSAAGNSSTEPPAFFLDHSFEFPPEPMLGTWSVQLLHADPVANDTTSFEVKEYVLPPFEVLLETPPYILPNTTQIAGAVLAKYHYGKPVQGKVQFKFGYREGTSKVTFIARTTIKSIEPNTGRVEFKIGADKFKDAKIWFPGVAGASLVVEATVTELTTGHREIVQDTSCLFLKLPYRLSFDEAVDDFKPGLTQPLRVQLVTAHGGRPGPAGVRLVAEYRDQSGARLDTPHAEGQDAESINRFDTEAVTGADGAAVFNVGPLREDISSLLVSVRASKSVGGKSAELASGQFSLVRHESQNGWISLMNKSRTHLEVGEPFVSDILIRDALVIPQKIFYVLANKGRILAIDTIDSNGLVSFRATEAMVPAVRLVLFALTHDSVGLLSDSMRISVGRDLTCGLALAYKSRAAPHLATELARPNELGRVEVSGRPGDVVSLVGVDNAVYSLNNRSAIGSSRILERVKRLDPGCGFGGGRNNLDVFHNAGLMLARAASEAQGAPLGSACLSFAHHFKYVEDSLLGFAKPMLAQLARPRESFATAVGHRSKREVDAEAVVALYSDPFQKSCCRLGTLEDEPQRRSCEQRKRVVEKYIRDAGRCSDIYYKCCLKIFHGESEHLMGSMGPEPPVMARSERPLASSPAQPSLGQLDQIEGQTLVRRDFRETWLFEVAAAAGPTGLATFDVRLPHSITAWSLSALALNRERPLCLAERPLLLRSFQEVFLQLAMPFKVVQGEQLDLVVSLFNHSPDDQELLVYLWGAEDVCSEAEPGERSEVRRVSLARHSSQAMIFSLIPLKVGRHPVRVAAIAASSNRSDVVERSLNVVPRGRPVTDETTFSLDPLNQQRRSKRAIQTGNLEDEIDSQRGLQRSRIHLAPSRESDYIVPQTQECIVSAIGDRLGQAVQTSLLDVENLIRLPHGCGEQVMIYLGPTLYTARYLQAIGKLTGDLRWRANRYIQSGYKRVLGFRNDEGAFSAFPGRSPSVWLTAFVAKLLCQAERTPFVAEEVHVDRTVVRSALNWLVGRQDVKSGTWVERNPVYHREMLGGVLKENGLSAFVVIAFNECAHHAAEVVDELALDRPATGPPPADSSAGHAGELTEGVAKLKLAAQRAEEALVLDRYRALKERNAYVLALVAYALSASRPREAAAVLADLMTLAQRSTARNQLFWLGDHQIETAAYALQAFIELAPVLATMEAPGYENQAPARGGWQPGADAVALANWLASRRSFSGGFESTQDTVVALEALSKFAQLQPTPNGGLAPQAGAPAPNLLCNVTISNRTRRSLEFGKHNAQVLQTFKLESFDFDPVSGETLDISTSGNGLGIMTVKLKYNVFQEEDELCRFNIDSAIEEWRPKIRLPAERPAGAGPARTSGAQSANASAEEDDFFRFDKSMLNELNLIDLSQNEPIPLQQPAPRERPPQAPQLRLRRSSPPASNQSWSSRLVAGIRSRLPTWLVPKGPAGTNATTRANVSTTPESKAAADGHEAHRRNSTFRRSAMVAGPPLVSPTPPAAGIPTNARLNTLSKQLEITHQNRSAGSLNVMQQIIDNPTRRLVLLLRVCAHHLSTTRNSEMAVIEVGILSGFKPNEADLKEIINDPGTPAMKYELSADRTMVLLYLTHIPNSGPFCFQFRLIRDSLVYNLQSGYIRVYEYYSPAQSCSNFYTPTKISNLLETRCDASGEVCQCAAKSLCPATNKLINLSAAYETNSTSARRQLVELVCRSRYDLVSLVKLKSVRFHEAARELRLAVKVTADLRGNLSRLVEAQRLQRTQLPEQTRKPIHGAEGPLDKPTPPLDEGSLDRLQLTIDPSCLRDDPLLLHMAHPSQAKQGGEQMILFARSSRLERRLFRSTQKTSASGGRRRGPRPRENVLGAGEVEAEAGQTSFQDAQNLQYSLMLPLDRDSILHDVSYQAKVSHREAINSLVLWLEIRSRREKWTCAQP